MIELPNATLTASIVLRLVGFGASLLLLYSARDYRFAFLSLLLSLMALRQILTLFELALPIAELPGLVVSVLAVTLVYYLRQYVRQEEQRKQKLSANNDRLREHRNRLQATFEASPDYVFVFDADSAYVEILSGRENITILDPETFPGRTVFEVLPEETAASVDEAIQETVRTGETQRVEYRLPFDDRTEWYEGRTAFVSYDDHEAEHVLFIARDITERKEREQELRRFRKAVEAAGHAIYITDRDGTIRYVNPAFEETTGYAADEAIGESTRILRSGEHDDALYRNLWDTILSGEVWEREMINRRKSTERYHANQTIAPIVDDDGDISEFVAIQTDITEQKCREEQLQQTREEYEDLFDGVSDPVFVHEPGDTFLAVNESAVELLGYAEDELLALDPTDVSARCDGTVWEFGREIRESGDARFESTFVTKAGEKIPVEVNATTVHYRGERRVLSVVRDISERRERERQLAVLDRVLRHNLRNDMTVILGYAAEIESQTSDEVAEGAATIRRVGTSLLDTADKERQVVELLSDQQSPRPVDVVPVVRRQVERIRESHPAADVRTVLPEAATAAAIGEVEQAVWELVENAVIHSDREAPAVEVAAEVRPETVEIRVADDGPGIPEQERTILTGEREIEPLYHGSGMGLWLVNWIVRLCDGDLRFGTADAGGSRVTIELPRAQSPPTSTTDAGSAPSP